MILELSSMSREALGYEQTTNSSFEFARVQVPSRNSPYRLGMFATMTSLP